MGLVTGPILMPHLFVQAKAKLKSHVDSKCDQIHHDKVPACVQRSWEFCRCLSAGTPFPSVPPGQSLKPQAENKPDLHHKVVPQEPTSDQEERPVSCAFIEHCKRPQSLSEETIKKLETTLRHKYLAFLSGLPALYCVAPSRATSPAVGQFAVTEIVVKKPQKSLTQMLHPCSRDDSEVSADITEEVQPEVQVEGKTEMVPLESQTPSPSSLNTELVARLSFHLKKKVLEIKLGIPITARELQEPNAVGSGTEHPQELVGSLSIPESIELQKLPDSGDLPPAPDASTDHRKKQPATAVQAVCHQRKKPSSKAVSQGSVHWNSKASQLRNVTKAQVPCVQTETSGEKPNLEEPGKPKAVGDFGEGDTGLGFSPTSEGTHHDEDQEPEKGPVHGTPEGSSQHSHSFHPEDPCPPSPQNTPELEFPDPPPEVFMEREPELDTQDSQTK
uniref:Uncharacterized protein n=1 Tax=Cricetulus griseus TaxID=10029 RepID=A0A8C2QLZ3_CRIGR